MKTIKVTLPDRWHAKLTCVAKQSGLSKSAVVRAALKQFLAGKREGKKFVFALEFAGDLFGSAEGPRDLGTNPKYMEEYGK